MKFYGIVVEEAAQHIRTRSAFVFLPSCQLGYTIHDAFADAKQGLVFDFKFGISINLPNISFKQNILNFSADIFSDLRLLRFESPCEKLLRIRGFFIDPNCCESPSSLPYSLGLINIPAGTTSYTPQLSYLCASWSVRAVCEDGSFSNFTASQCICGGKAKKEEL